MIRHAALVVMAMAAAAPTRAQHVALGPTFVFADYREVSPALRYLGTGPGVFAEITFHRISLEGSAAWVSMNPEGAGGAATSFKATQFDSWLRWNVTDYLSLETGFTHQQPDAEFAAQSFGAIRFGVQTHYGLGHGATIALRGAYLAGARFSGGGEAPLALELGLALKIAFSNRLRGLADYSFQRLDRTTHPGGGAEADAALQQARGRAGLVLSF